MTFQYIINHLDEPHAWYIILTGPHAELDTKEKLERKGFIAYLPLVPVRRCWAGHIKEIHTPAMARCVWVYATDEEIKEIRKEYRVVSLETLKVLHQD